MYNIEISDTAGKVLSGFHNSDRKLYSRLIAAIESLAENPAKGKKLKGQFKGDYSLRVGNYRIVYTCRKEKLVIYIIDVGHRKVIYHR